MFESEEELKRQVQIKSEAKAQWLHSVRMLRDDADNVYLLATADTVTLPKWSVLGSFGSGKVREVNTEADVDREKVEFFLPRGDRTPIMVSAKPCNDPEKEDEALQSSAPTTLYKATKSLIKAGVGA